MPVTVNQESRQFGHVILWEIAEDECFFKEKLRLSDPELSVIDGMHPKRRMEWLCGRYLIRTFLDFEPEEIVVDEFGKPRLPDNGKHISLSHSGGRVALAYSDQIIGLDIQEMREGISRMAHKFCTDNDYHHLSRYANNIEIQHLTWVSKEAVYKAFGRRKIDFRRDMIIRSCTKNEERLVLSVDLVRNDLSMSFVVFTSVWTDMYTAVAVVK